jgi:hypothetical protein
MPFRLGKEKVAVSGYKGRGESREAFAKRFWLVLPSLALLVVLPFLLRAKMKFYESLGASLAAMLVCYGVMLVVLNRPGVRL